MMEEGYRADGWLGLLLGTRLYFQFVGADLDDAVSFERRVDAVVRELGDQGKVSLALEQPPQSSAVSSAPVPVSGGMAVSEAVPPPRPSNGEVSATPRQGSQGTPTARASASATPPAGTAGARSLPYTPSMTEHDRASSPLSGVDHHGVVGMPSAAGIVTGSSFDAITAFIGQQQDKLLATLREERAGIRSEMEAQLEISQLQISQLQARTDWNCHTNDAFYSHNSTTKP